MGEHTLSFSRLHDRGLTSRFAYAIQVYNGQVVENNRQKNLEATMLTNRFQSTSSA